MSGANIGMMDPAFFVGRKAILDWLNGTFGMHLEKIEETASGAVACQVLDAIYPDAMPMSKVKWDAKSAHEFVDNYKLVQRVLQSKGVDKFVDVEKLVRAKHQDNLEFCQWLKSFFEKNYAGAPYDALGRRAKGKGADSMPAYTTQARNGAAAAPVPAARPAAAAAGSVPVSSSSARSGVAGVGAPSAAASAAGRSAASSGAAGSAASRGASAGGVGAKPTTTTAAAGSAAAAGGKPPSPAKARLGAAAPSAPAAATAALQQRVEELTAEAADLRLSVEQVSKERDFYFSKLREIEILLQSYAGPDRPTVDAVFKIMYTSDDPDFVSPSEAELQQKQAAGAAPQ